MYKTFELAATLYYVSCWLTNNTPTTDMHRAHECGRCGLIWKQATYIAKGNHWNALAPLAANLGYSPNPSYSGDSVLYSDPISDLTPPFLRYLTVKNNQSSAKQDLLLLF